MSKSSQIGKQELNVHYRPFCGGESPSICPFLINNGDEDPKGSGPNIFQEWPDTMTFSDLKYTSTKI